MTQEVVDQAREIFKEIMDNIVLAAFSVAFDAHRPTEQPVYQPDGILRNRALEQRQRVQYRWQYFHSEELLRHRRFEGLRAKGKKLCEINRILEIEGYSEVSGEGVMKAVTPQHRIIRDCRYAQRMIKKGALS
jgi:inhibitor of KinA sporulation pathway (predicted exonuclease)